MKKRDQVDEAVNPLTALGKLKSAYQTYKYGTTLPKEIEAVKQARLDTELKKAQVKLAKQGKLPAAADDAAAAADVKPKGAFGKAADAIKYPFKHPIKTAAGATAAATGYEYLKDPKADIGTLVGRGIKDVVDVGGQALGWAAEKGAKLAGDIARGYTGADKQVADKDKETKDQPQAARPTNTTIPLPTKGIGFDELREQSLGKLLEKYNIFLNENVITADDLAFIKDPNVRKAILAKASRESGGKNVGEISYKNTAPAQIRKALPQLAKYSDAELNALKQDTRKFFDVAYKDIGGYQYRGRGPIQITGRAQYAQIDKDLGLKGALVKDPDMLLRDPALAKAASLQYLKNAKLDQYQSKNEIDAAQRVIHAIGGKAYAPGTKRGNRELAAVEKLMPVVGATGTVIATQPADQKVKPTVPAGSDRSAAITTEPTAAPTQVAATDAYKDVPIGGLPKFDWEAFRQAARSGEDVDTLVKNADRFNIPATQTTKPAVPGLSEANQPIDYNRASQDYYDMRAKKLGATASELSSVSQGQFAKKADRLNQAKVDAVLGPGFRAGSKEANLALLQHFRQNPAIPGQAGRPSPTPSPAVPAVRGAENLTPYSTAADVAGLTGLAAAGGQFLPKVGGIVAKAVPGLNVAYQGADALRRASLGDTTGSAISAAGAVPVLGIPAIAAQAVRDKYRTGSFFPSDEELKTAVDRDRGVAPTPAATPATQAATPKLKEGNKMNKKQLKKRLEKLEETKLQMIQGMHDRAIAEGRADAAIRFAKMLRGLGGGAEALPASTIRKGGQTFDKVRGVDSELKYVNRASPTDIKSLDDIKNIGSKPPAVWRKGGDAGAATTASKAAGAADDVAAAAAKGGKPLSRTATALGSAAGGALIGYGLGMGGDDKPQPSPDPTPSPIGPDPAPRPTPPKPTPVKPEKDDPFDLRPVKPSVDDTPGSEDWLRRRVNQPTTDTTKPTDDAKDLSDRYGPDSYVARTMAEDLNEIKRLAGLAKK